MSDLNDIISNLKQDAPTLVKDNIALAKAEIVPAAKHAGVGGGMFGGAGYLALNAVSLLFMAGSLAFGLLFAKLLHWGVLASACLGFVCMAVVLLAIAGILAMLGKKQIDQVQKPEATIAEAKATKEALLASVKRGQNAAVSGAVLEPTRPVAPTTIRTNGATRA